MLNENPGKGTQTDVFNETPSVTVSESMKTPEQTVKEQIQEEEIQSIKSSDKEQDRERERTQKKSVMRRVYDAMFGEDEFKEERDELRNMKQRIEE